MYFLVSYFDPRLLAFRCFGMNLFFIIGVTALGGTVVVTVAVISSEEDLHCFLCATGLQLVTLMTGDKVSVHWSSGYPSASVIGSSSSSGCILLSLFLSSCTIVVLLLVPCSDPRFFVALCSESSGDAE